MPAMSGNPSAVPSAIDEIDDIRALIGYSYLFRAQRSVARATKLTRVGDARSSCFLSVGAVPQNKLGENPKHYGTEADVVPMP
jgi:hypothetical protein